MTRLTKSPGALTTPCRRFQRCFACWPSRSLGRNGIYRPALDQALTSLRDFDDKAHLAYALNFAADDALAARPIQPSPDCGDRGADGGASDVSRATEIVVAGSMLARADYADGDRSAATARIQALNVGVGSCDPQRAGKDKPREGRTRYWLRIGTATQRETGLSRRRKFVT